MHDEVVAEALGELEQLVEAGCPAEPVGDRRHARLVAELRRDDLRVQPVPQRGLKRRAIDPSQTAHHGIGFLSVKLAAEEHAAQHGNQSDGDHRGGQHRKRLGERERVKELALLSRQRKDRDEGEQDDRHREEHRPADEPGGLANSLQHTRTIAGIVSNPASRAARQRRSPATTS